MRVETKYVYEITFRAPDDAWFAIQALSGAAAEWATCSNESEPLLELRDQLRAQFEEGAA